MIKTLTLCNDNLKSTSSSNCQRITLQFEKYVKYVTYKPKSTVICRAAIDNSNR